MSTSTNRERVPTMWVQGSPQLFQPTQRVQTHSHTHTLTHSHTHTLWRERTRAESHHPDLLHFLIYIFFPAFFPYILKEQIPSHTRNT